MKNFLALKRSRWYCCRFCSMRWNTDIPIFQKVLSLMFHLDIETLNSPSMEVWYLPSWSLSKTCGNPLTIQNVGFVPRIRNLKVRIFQIMQIFIHLGIQSHLQPQLQASCLPPSLQSSGFRF